MSQYTQLEGILSGRNYLDDQYDTKQLFRFRPLQGVVDGVNLTFQIPQTRLVVAASLTPPLFPQIYKNNAPLNFGVDYTIPNPKSGVVLYINSTTPQQGDTVDVTFNWVWFDDIEWDRHLTAGAKQIGYPVYYVSSSALPMGGTADALPPGAVAPSDIPDALFDAICMLGAAHAAEALSSRFSTRYDTSAGDQSFNPSQMAEAFEKVAKTLEEKGLAARDDYYKGQGKQYKSSIAKQGYILPNVTPAR